MRLLFFLLFAVSPLIGGELSGKITDLSGMPVEGVRICITSWFCDKSDREGNYKIDNSWNTNNMHSKFIRFSKKGYKAVILEISKDNIDIVLEKATKGYDELFVPNCPVDIDSKNKLIGNNRFYIVVSNRALETKSNGGDYEVIYVPSQLENNTGNKNNYLIFMAGPSVSNGLPSWEESLETIYNRDVTYDNITKLENGLPYVSIVDIKTRSKEGKYSRFIGHSFEIIYYDDVSKETAKIFDNILDSLCVIEPVYPE